MKKRKSRAKRGSAAGILLLAALLLLVFGVLWNKLTVVNVIEVTGVSAQDAQEIAQKSGIEEGMHMRDIDQTKVGRALGALGKWEYLGMETEGQRTVRLHMRTRTPRAVAHYAGATVVMDEYGQVMEKTVQDPEYSLLEVLGLNIRGADIGAQLETEDINQVLSLSEVILALDETGAYSCVQVLNASDLDNMYLITVTGVRVNLGDASNMQAKCNWMLGVLDSLQSEGRSGGTVDVSTGSSAVYKPE